MNSQNTQVSPVAENVLRAAGMPCGDSAPQTMAPPLLRMSEIERSVAPGSPMACIATWVREFLARPHPQLGRKGSVCPFVPLSLEMDSIWMAEVTDPAPSLESVSAIVTEYLRVFTTTEPLTGADAMQKSFLIVLPTLDGDNPEWTRLVDDVQLALKKQFVEKGLMLGEFHAGNETPGLRNPDFRPLRSPIPMLAIRHMVDSDLPFLVRESYTAQERASFLRAYLAYMNGSLTQTKFCQVLDQLIALEREVWSTTTQRLIGAASDPGASAVDVQPHRPQLGGCPMAQAAGVVS
jgi:hypothetical protein